MLRAEIKEERKQEKKDRIPMENMKARYDRLTREARQEERQKQRDAARAAKRGQQNV